MPYVPAHRRQWQKADNAGELNYLITSVCHRYLEEHGERYQTYADILSALEGAKLELYRRWVAPYEDRKIEENGDVRPNL